MNHSRMRGFDILHDFILSCVKEENVPEYEDDLLMDLYLREKSKSRPSWAADLSGYKSGLQEFFKKEAEEKKTSKVVWIFAIIGIIAAVAAAVYGVYRFFTPDYLEDFEDDFEDDYDDDFFEDEEDEEEPAKPAEKKEEE